MGGQVHELEEGRKRSYLYGGVRQAFGELKKITKNFSQVSRYQGQDSNRALAKHDPTVLPLHQPARQQVLLMDWIHLAQE
jgi:hypothetical protein